jgi:hypothetical protein
MTWRDGRTERLLGYATAMVVVGAVMIGLRYLWRLFIVGAARRIRRACGSRSMSSCSAWTAPIHHRASTGEQMALATNDLEAVAQACGFGVLTLFDALFLVALQQRGDDAHPAEPGAAQPAAPGADRPLPMAAGHRPLHTASSACRNPLRS